MAEVVIYTRMMCIYCTRAKRLLQDKGIAFDERDATMGGAPRAEMLARSNGHATFPQIFIDGRHIGGCDDLYALDRGGKLDGMLGR